MRLVTPLLDFFGAGVFFQLAIFIAISLTRRYEISSSSIRVTLLVMLLISTFISPGQTVDQDLSFIESFLRILTSLSAFVISELPSIVILIVFLVHPTPFPLLMLSETLDDSNTRRRFFNLCDSRLYQLELSTIRGKRCWVSPHGSFFGILNLLVICILLSDVYQDSKLIFIFLIIVQIYFECRFLFYSHSDSHESHAPSWSELPTEMIGEIANRLPNFMDIKSIEAVCKSWGSACSETETTRPPPFPLVKLSETLVDSNTRQCFFNLCDSRRYQLELSRIRGKRCWGSPHGVVITLSPDYDIHIENLDQRIEPIALPPLDTIRRELAGREEWFRLVHKFIIFKEPAESDHGLSFLVFAIFGPENHLAFARPGQDEWTIFTNPNNLEFKDVARLQGQIWGLCDNGLLVRFEFEGTQLLEVVVIASPPEDAEEPQKLYLVESRENLYGVFRYRKSLQSFFWRRRSYKTTGFSVFKFNFSASEWEEVNDLEDHALFVGDCNSWCIPTIPQIRVNDGSFVRSNSIYFTDDNWEWQMLAGVAYGGHDVGVFDMERRVIQRLPFGKDTPLYYSRPIWVTPNLLLNVYWFLII